jgi:hypothetical protein
VASGHIPVQSLVEALDAIEAAERAASESTPSEATASIPAQGV